MSEANPFKLETDNKKFYFGLGSQSGVDSLITAKQVGANRIKKIQGELQELAVQREKMLFKDSQIDYIFKKEKPVIALNDFITGIGGNEKKFRVRALLKEKKESLHEFLDKKKEIYLSKMNITIKKEQTTKLEDCIRDEEETLKARKLYFENDVDFMHKFIDGIKKQAEDAQAAVQNELKIQQTLVSRLNALEAEAEKIDNLIAKDNEILSNLKTYKGFIDSFYDPERKEDIYSRKMQPEEILFMTENMVSSDRNMMSSDKNVGKMGKLGSNKEMNGEQDELVIRFQPSHVLQIFNNAEQNNIREIQNLHDKEDEMESFVKQYVKQETEFEQLNKENQGRIDLLEKTYEKKLLEGVQLREMKRNNTNKINVLDNENIDLEKVGNRIYDIVKEISSKKAPEMEETRNQKFMKKAMTEIEHEIEKLRNFIKRERESHPQLMGEVEKEIKENQKRENQARKREEAKEQEQRKQREQEKKKSEPVNDQVKGRRDMKKVIIEKKAVVKKEVDVKSVDESEKYFVAD